MPKLAETLSGLLARCDAGEKAPRATLPRGLEVLVRRTPQGRQLVLHRKGGKTPSLLEAQTCASQAGWAGASIETLVTPRGGHCLTVTEPPAAAAPSTSPEGTCGSCDHATPSDDPGLLDCQLGWEAHDAFWSEHRKELVAMGHGDALLPVSSPGCRCGAQVAGRAAWTPRKGGRAA